MSRERTPGGSASNLLCLCLRELLSTFSRLTQRVELSDAELEGNIRQLSFRIQRLENIQRRSKAFRSELRAHSHSGQKQTSVHEMQKLNSGIAHQIFGVFWTVRDPRSPSLGIMNLVFQRLAALGQNKV